MSLSEEEIGMITEAILPRIAEPLRDVATGHQMAIQLVRDTLEQLEECKLRLEAMTIDISRLKHSDVDAETAIGLNQDLAGRYKLRIDELEEHLVEKQMEINGLKKILNGR